MDNYNALSKSAILTKLALDGYFIDLLTLNSFIKLWNIEAIYENEFGIEFFDNSSYLTILNKLKEKYAKTKENIQESLAAEISSNAQSYKDDCIQQESMPDLNSNNVPEMDLNQFTDDIGTSSNNELLQNNIANQLTEDISTPIVEANEPIQEQIQEEITVPKNVEEDPYFEENISVTKSTPLIEPEKNMHNSCDSVSLEELAIESAGEKHVYNAEFQEIPDGAQKHNTATINKEKYAGAVMPMAMRKLTPGPVTPNSNFNVSHDESDDFFEELGSCNEESGNTDKLDEILEIENFRQKEIKKADNLIKNAKINNPQEQYASDNKTKGDELDLVQLAQSFAQDLTGGISSEPVPAANLEQIFNESYTEPFEELQSFVKDTPEEDSTLGDDLLNTITPPEIRPPAPVQRLITSANLTAEDVREIIREEISRQAANTPTIPQYNDNIREIIREIVKQTTDVAPQNAFKLDISNRTLDMIAKSIAKKIAVKLNDYYKLNSSKQEEKLKLFRDRTIDLKEKNQALAQENQKLKNTLMETRRDLNSYKPTIFGLYKFSGRKRK